MKTKITREEAADTLSTLGVPPAHLDEFIAADHKNTDLGNELITLMRDRLNEQTFNNVSKEHHARTLILEVMLSDYGDWCMAHGVGGAQFSLASALFTAALVEAFDRG